MKNVIDVLSERGFIEAITSEELRTLAGKPLKIYAGFDPTAESLHLGNLVAIMGLAWFQKFGHTPVAIVGGATGMVGDPSGKTSERQLLDEATIQKNLVGIRKNLEAVLGKGPLTLLNNYDWFKNFTFIDFLRDVGKYFRVGVMMAKDSVKNRMNSDEGMSFTEFSYQLLQGYDFLHLYDTYGVTVQIGGSDQWGNIIAGTDLIRKVRGGQAYGITLPLLTRSDGQKFGKSEKGAIWLSEEKLSCYEFYQYLIRVPDADVITLMRMLTFMDMEEIRSYEAQMKSANYIPNTAQKRLAEEITRLVHGPEGLDKALKVTQAASPGADAVLSVPALEAIAQHMPNYTVSPTEFDNVKLVDFLVKLNLQPSKSEARRLIRNGGVYLNNQQTMDEQYSLTKENLVEGTLLLLALGKKNKVLVRVAP